MRHALSIVIISAVLAFVAGIVIWTLSDINQDTVRIAPTIKEDVFAPREDDNDDGLAEPDFDVEYLQIEAMGQTFCADPYAETICRDSCDGALWEIKRPAHGFADCQKRCCATAYKDDPERDKEIEGQEAQE